MQFRQLGQSGLKVSPLALGGNVFGWTVDEQDAGRILDAFLDAGGNLVDLADSYPHWAPGCSGGESEEAVGRWLAASGKRDKVLLATKVGKWSRSPGLSRKNILASVDGSLRRLRTDVIDLYQAHADDPDTPLEETLEAFAELVQAGKVRAIGASNHSAPRLAEALQVSARHGWPRYESIQPEYNLVQREPFENELLPLVTESGLGALSYFSLAAGFLTGKYHTEADLAGRARGGMVRGYLTTANLRVLAAVEQVADKHGVTPAQVAVAWVMTQPGITAAIASATSLAQLQQLTDSASLRLDSDDCALLAPGRP